MTLEKAHKFSGIGQIILVIGSLMYVAELVGYGSKALTLALCVVYGISIVFMLIGWFGTKEERKAQKEKEKAQKAAKKASR